jgi:protein phosphatase
MKAYTITNIGKVRKENQDGVRFVRSTPAGCAILVICDGMGGARAGATASQTALDVFTDVLETLLERETETPLSELTKRAAVEANTAVFKLSSSNESFKGMGTTLVAAVVRGRSCCVANIGDSRAYLIADGSLKQITLDHSYVGEMYRSGALTREQARIHPKRNIITRALGVDPQVEVDTFSPKFKKGALLLLCSDGLSNTLTDSEILEIIYKCEKLEEKAERLLDLALSRGAPDNVTIGLLQK